MNQKSLAVSRKPKLDPFFELMDAQTHTEMKFANDDEDKCFANVHLKIFGEVQFNGGDGDGPIDAIFNTMTRMLRDHFSDVADIRLVSYKPKIIDAEKVGTKAFVKTKIGLIFNGQVHYFTGIHKFFDKSGAIAISQGLLACLEMMHENLD